MLHKITRPNASLGYNDGMAKFETPKLTPAFGRPSFEKTSIGHFYSDNHKMAAPKRPMMEMCHTDDHDGFTDHIISTHLGEFGEIDD